MRRAGQERTDYCAQLNSVRRSCDSASGSQDGFVRKVFVLSYSAINVSEAENLRIAPHDSGSGVCVGLGS